MNKQIQTAASQHAALETKGATTMNKIIRNSLTITAFAALALVFGACSQPAELAPNETSNVQVQTQPDLSAATDVIADPSADTTASAEDLNSMKDLTGTDASSSLQTQGGDKTPPVLTYAEGYNSSSYGYAALFLQFSEKMNHDSVCKKAIKVVVVTSSGAVNAKGKCYWYTYGNFEYVYWYSNKTFSNHDQVNWKVTRDAKDKAGNKLFAGKNGVFSISY
jgi:hypothetical protein